MRETDEVWRWRALAALAEEVCGFLGEAQGDVKARSGFYRNLYEEHRLLGTLPQLDGRDPVEAACTTGLVRKLKK
jgi:hypothetical protein